ncbi:MAG: ATP-dependent helicase [Deltaproteobacteria bacterium]|nr:ATP-dependent helicase [Deltaproteobacteria bacterium]MBZ0219511.1 ATP-dependent helicase [Deltaproteobacteria bacterium]
MGELAPMKLDSSQEKAVLSAARRILVVAGPGSGKTRILAARFSRLVQNGAGPERVLAVTFTNRAAREMRARVLSTLPGARPENISTFHSLGLRLLREEMPSLRLLARDECRALLKELDAEEPDKALERISAFKNGMAPDVADSGLLSAYSERLESLQAIDFDDIVPASLRLIHSKSGRPFDHIMIDEYQDINPVQAAFVKALAEGAESLLAIGDPDQAIYSFRGSSLRCFLDFEKEFGDTEIIRLGTNYRSGRAIAEASKALISKNTERLPNEAAPAREGGSLEEVECGDEREEARHIIGEIERLMGGLTSLSVSDDIGLRFSDFAVLVRTNRQAELMAEEFARSPIPFHIVKPSGPGLAVFIKILRGLEAPEDMPLQEFVMREAQMACLDSHALGLVEFALKGAAGFEGREGLACLIDELMLDTPSDNLDISADRVNIMTLHAAKGLEWRCVFLAGAEDGLVPMRMKGECDLEEERRLFYVGMTRAMDRLFLLRARKRRTWGESKECRRSPFLEELPAALVEIRRMAAKIPPKKKPVQKGLFE